MGEVADLMVRFGHLVAAQRKAAGMTQAQLASASGISADMIARIEGGGTGVRFPNLQGLANALGVDPAAFFVASTEAGRLQRPVLANLVARLASFSDDELETVAAMVDLLAQFRR